MRTEDVRIDTRLNQFVWSSGVRNLPKKIRVRVTRKRNEDNNEKKSEWYTLVQHVEIPDFIGRLTEKAKVA